MDLFLSRVSNGAYRFHKLIDLFSCRPYTAESFSFRSRVESVSNFSRLLCRAGLVVNRAMIESSLIRFREHSGARVGTSIERITARPQPYLHESFTHRFWHCRQYSQPVGTSLPLLPLHCSPAMFNIAVNASCGTAFSNMHSN